MEPHGCGGFGVDARASVRGLFVVAIGDAWLKAVGRLLGCFIAQLGGMGFGIGGGMGIVVIVMKGRNL